MDEKMKKIAEVSGDFKSLRRSGWVQHGVKKEESVADHTWGLSFLTLMFTPNNLDRAKCLELATIHDLAEIEAGDITPADGISAEEKRTRETIAMKKISKELGEPYFMDLFQELEEQKTPESQFIKQLDKIEVVLQAYYFVKHGYMDPIVYQEYYNSSKAKIHLPYLVELFHKLVPNYQDIPVIK